MRNTLLMLAIIGMSSSAMADWIALGGNDVQDNYIDSSNIYRSGSIVSATSLYDFKRPREFNGNDVRSSLVRYKFDCDRERYTPIESISYTGNMAGDAIADSWIPRTAWQVVIPATPLGNIFQYACRTASP
jgi:hypothetical protein